MMLNAIIHILFFFFPFALVKVTQLYSTLCDLIDYMVHGILQARVLEWIAFPFSRGSPQPRDQTQVSHIAGGFFISWATRERIPTPLFWPREFHGLCSIIHGVEMSWTWLSDLHFHFCTKFLKPSVHFTFRTHFKLDQSHVNSDCIIDCGKGGCLETTKGFPIKSIKNPTDLEAINIK